MQRWADLGRTSRIIFATLWRGFQPIVRYGFHAVGMVAVVLLVLAFTRIPFDAHRWLGTAAGECRTPVEVIVVLGGSGMPSGPELLRLHRAAELAAAWPLARVVVIHPGDGAALSAMVDELRMRGLTPERVDTLNRGDNTREQAFVLREHLQQPTTIALVTSPENMYRSIRSFQRAGFPQVCGVAAWEHAMFHDFAYTHKRIGGQGWVPDVSDQLDLRYTFWNYLKLEITCLREYVAIGYYWLNGWI